MSTSQFRSHALSARALAVTVVALSLGALGAGSASAAVTLDWSQANVYDTTAAAGTDRTWLGYVTNTIDFAGPNSASNGSQVASGGATGAAVTTASPRGADALFKVSYPAVAGSLNEGAAAAATSGELKFSGTVTWDIHGTAVTFTNPRVVLHGDGTGALYASGVNGASAYDETTGPVFELDLDGQDPNPGAPASAPGTQAGFAAARWTLNFDGTRTLAGIVPKVASPNTTSALIFGAAYAAGAGPDRIPARFGGFAISYSPNTGPAGSDGADGAGGAIGPQGPAGPPGKDGKDAKVKTIKLRKAVFGNKKAVAKITLKGRFVGYAEIKGRKAKVTYVTEKLKGTYKLTTVTGKKRTASVRLG